MRFYKSLPTENNRSFTLEEVSQLLVRFELTQSALQGTTALVTGKRLREGAAPPSKRKPGISRPGQSLLDLWIHKTPMRSISSQEGHELSGMQRGLSVPTSLPHELAG